MSGPSKISRTDVARYFALLQPSAIAERLFANASFHTEFALASRDAISFAGGPAILKAALYESVRKVFVEQKRQSFAALTGEMIAVDFNEEDISLSFPGDGGINTTVRPRYLMFLSLSAEVRQTALQRTLNELGPTGPDPDYWHKELQQKALDNDGMDLFWHQTDASVVANMGRVGWDIMSGVVDKSHIVPRSPTYWETLCGPSAGGVDQEAWLKEVFEPHRRRLVERDLVQGLDLCLAMGIRDDVTARSLISRVSRDELWTALERLRPIDDPFSLLGVVDLAVGFAGDDERFAVLAAETVGRLCGEQLLRSDGLDVYAFLPAVLDLVLAELRALPSTAARPAFWRRICAWTQAALLVRAFQTIPFEPEQFSANMKSLYPGEAETAELLDLRQSPLSLPSETSGLCIRAEVLGRLEILRNREAEQGRELPGWESLAKTLADQANKAPFLSRMPGPLEVHQLPFYRFENLPDGFENFRASLQVQADELTSAVTDENWVRFFYLCRIFLFDKHILGQITKLTASAHFGTTDEERRAALVHMVQLSYIAVAQRYVPLAEAILTRCLQSIGTWIGEQHARALVHIGFIATAAWGQEPVTKERLAKYLRELAFLLPQGPPCRVLCDELEVLKTFTPLVEWQNFAQAEALCRLGS